MRGERPMCRWLVAGMSCTTRPRWARDVVVAAAVAVEAVAAVTVWRRRRFAERAQVRSRRRPDLMCVSVSTSRRCGALRHLSAAGLQPTRSPPPRGELSASTISTTVVFIRARFQKIPVILLYT